MNVILYKLLYRKRLLFELYKHLIYRCYLIGKYVPWNFGKFWRQSLGFFVMSIGTCMLVIQKEMIC